MPFSAPKMLGLMMEKDSKRLRCELWRRVVVITSVALILLPSHALTVATDARPPAPFSSSHHDEQEGANLQDSRRHHPQLGPSPIPPLAHPAGSNWRDAFPEKAVMTPDLYHQTPERASQHPSGTQSAPQLGRRRLSSLHHQAGEGDLSPGVASSIPAQHRARSRGQGRVLGQSQPLAVPYTAPDRNNAVPGSAQPPLQFAGESTEPKMTPSMSQVDDSLYQTIGIACPLPERRLCSVQRRIEAWTLGPGPVYDYRDASRASVVQQLGPLLPTAAAVDGTSSNSSSYPPDMKYFHEAPGCHHLDARWHDLTLKHWASKRMEALSSLYSAWSAFAEERQLLYWIAHGSLLGWTWNREILAWDDDIDLQTTGQALLTAYIAHNNTWYRSRYLLDVNPNAQYRFPQKDNVIDARFVDSQTGLFIDITGLSFNASARMSPSVLTSWRGPDGRAESLPDDEDDGVIQCKTPHRYRTSEIFPLKRVEFMGSPGWRPNNVIALLGQEYGPRSMYTTIHNGHVFSRSKHRWIVPSDRQEVMQHAHAAENRP